MCWAWTWWICFSVDKSLVFLNMENSTNSTNYYAAQEQYVIEIEKLKQQNSYIQAMLIEKEKTDCLAKTAA